MVRSISHTEASAAFTCQAAHAFGYTGHLTAGDALRPRDVKPILRDGRAWGRAVAALHETAGPEAGPAAVEAMVASLEEDAERMRDAGSFDPDEYAETFDRLADCLTHYAATTEQMSIVEPERELLVPIPSRTGRRRSTRYRLQYFVDGLNQDDESGLWLVEYKFRGQLSSLAQVALSRQIRWGAWAWRETTGITPAGVIVDERLSVAPKPARIVKAKRKGDGIDGMTVSHAKDQATTVDSYLETCARFGADPEPETVEALRARRWQERHRVVLTNRELDEAGEQLVSAAQLIGQLDAGRLYPVRNPSPRSCGGCQFRDVCPNPHDADLVDALFERRPPKRLRPTEEVIAA